MRRLIAIPLMALLWTSAIVPASIRNLSHWLCKWLDRWFDLVGKWAAIETNFLPFPMASKQSIEELPPGLGWLPKPNLGKTSGN